MTRSDPLGVARDHWGDDAVPDWIEALAKACTAASQARIAKRLGYSAGVVSSVLRNAYAGNMEAVETAIRGALMGGTLICPELGEIKGDVCTDNRRRAQTFQNTNSHRVRMFRACRNCPRFKGE